MSEQKTWRKVHLVASTSMLAISLMAAPVTLDFDDWTPVTKQAFADSDGGEGGDSGGGEGGEGGDSDGGEGGEGGDSDGGEGGESGSDSGERGEHGEAGTYLDDSGERGDDDGGETGEYEAGEASADN